jgi:D-amino-acid oxidase
MAEVVVIGGGVVGLTCALTLRERGHRVRVIAAATGAGTTSWAAGAVWYPFRADPPEKVRAWAFRTREWLIELARHDASAGVDVLTRLELVDDDVPPWWAVGLPDLRLLRKDAAGDTFVGSTRHAWSHIAPRCEPAIHLAWLERTLGVPVEIRRVASFAEVDAPWIVNCTGLGARGLTGDDSLQAVFGQTVITEPGGIDLRVAHDDERSLESLFYSIPRRSEVVLGGCAELCADHRTTTPSHEMTARILARTRAHGLSPGAVKRESAGLRPCRDAGVRLEKDANDPRVIHNYGHGGAGYTLARGCAEEVAEVLVRDAESG